MAGSANRSLGTGLGLLHAVRPGELRLVGHFALLFFLVSAGLALGRGTADALFFKRYGIEYLPLVFVAQSALLAAVSAVYTAFVDRVPAERAFNVISGVMTAVLAASWWAMTATPTNLLYPVYYLAYEVASDLLLVHAPIYFSQNLDTQAAKRLAPTFYAGGQLGTIAGGTFLGLAAAGLGVENLLLGWATLLLAGIALVRHWHRGRGQSAYYRAGRRSRQPLRAAIAEVASGARLVRDSSLMRRNSLALFFLVIAFYVLGYSVNRVYAQTLPSEAALATFFGVMIAVNSLLTLILEVFVTGRLIQRFGLRRANLVFPVTTFVSYLGLILHFGLASAIVASVNKGAIMSGVRTPVQAVYLNAMPPRVQGRAAALAVMLVIPAGLVVCGGALWAIQRLDNPLLFLMPGALAAAAHLYFSHRTNQAYLGTLLDSLKTRVALPADDLAASLRGGGEPAFAGLVRGLQSPDEEVSASFARVLAASFPDQVAESLRARLSAMSDAGVDRLVSALSEVPPAFRRVLLDRAQAADDHLRSTIIRRLASEGAQDLAEEVTRALGAPNPRLVTAGIRGVLRAGLTPLRPEAVATWRQLLAGPAKTRLAALDLVPELRTLSPGEAAELQGRYRETVRDLLATTDDGGSARVLTALSTWDGAPLPELEPVIERLLSASDPEGRAAAVRAARLLPGPDARNRVALQGLDDGHPLVRAAGLAVTLDGAPPAADGARSLIEDWVIAGNRGSPRAQATLLEGLIARGLPTALLQAVSRAKAADASQLGEALGEVEAAVHSGRTGLALLEQTLRERVEQTIDLALLAAQAANGGDALATIRAGLWNGDARLRADAREALEHLEDRELARSLAGTLRNAEQVRPGPRSVRSRNAVGVLAWAGARDDPWLSACARHAARSEGGRAP
jgi:hypothetical protein